MIAGVARYIPFVRPGLNHSACELAACVSLSAMEGMVKSDSSSPQGREVKEQIAPAAPKTSRKRLLVIVLLSAVLSVVIALGLGLGLGLGLKHHGSSFAPSNGTSSPVAYNPPLGNEPWRRNPSEYTLDTTMWDLNAPPTTRVYNFTISEVEGFPDGEQ